jgi:hypothetical protein
LIDSKVDELLEELSVALDDWTNTYASEFCKKNNVEGSLKRMHNAGGTLAYIANLRQRICETREAPKQK